MTTLESKEITAMKLARNVELSNTTFYIASGCRKLWDYNINQIIDGQHRYEIAKQYK